MGVSVSFKISGYSEEYLEKKLEKMYTLLNFKDMPFICLPKNGEISKVKEIAEELRESFNTLVVVGMGGSSLGMKAVHNALGYKAEREILFLDNIDPILVSETLRKLNWKKTAFAFISKSGKTLETVTILNIVLDKLKQKVSKFQNHLLFIGDPGKSFEKLAKELGCLFLPVPPEVGGRFSVFTPVGLFPSAFAGYSVEAFLKGAQEVIEDSKTAFMLGVWKFLHYSNGRKISVLMPYSSHLEEFTEWYAQLWGESLGKENKGQTPVKAIGTSSQHSVLQLFMDGPDDKVYQFFFVEKYPEDPVLPKETKILPFIAKKKLSDVMKAEFCGTVQALSQKKRPIVIFRLEKLSEFELGYLFMTYMIATVAMAKLMNVNPYGQPAVEIGKKFALKELSDNIPNSDSCSDRNVE
jgi:glucose-6-phosphate isomerase